MPDNIYEITIHAPTVVAALVALAFLCGKLGARVFKIVRGAGDRYDITYR